MVVWCWCRWWWRRRPRSIVDSTNLNIEIHYTAADMLRLLDDGIHYFVTLSGAHPRSPYRCRCRRAARAWLPGARTAAGESPRISAASGNGRPAFTTSHIKGVLNLRSKAVQSAQRIGHVLAQVWGARQGPMPRLAVPTEGAAAEPPPPRPPLNQRRRRRRRRRRQSRRAPSSFAPRSRASRWARRRQIRRRRRRRRNKPTRVPRKSTACVRERGSGGGGDSVPTSVPTSPNPKRALANICRRGRAPAQVVWTGARPRAQTRLPLKDPARSRSFACAQARAPAGPARESAEKAGVVVAAIVAAALGRAAAVRGAGWRSVKERERARARERGREGERERERGRQAGRHRKRG